MADRFPRHSHTVDPADTHIDYSFSHLIACVKEGPAPGHLKFPNAVAVDSNNNQNYVVQGCYSPKRYSINIARVSIFSETGEFLNTFSHPDMKWPWGIAIHRDNVYVTDIVEHSVLHFKVAADFRFVAKQGGKGSGIGQFDDPGQLAVSTDGDIFVPEFSNNRVQILDSKLRHQRHISHHSIVLPRDVKLTPEEVYILCQTTPCIRVFSYTGDLIRSLVTRGDFGMQVVYPWFFCLDSNSNLLLSDCSARQIRIFSKEGTLLHTFGEGKSYEMEMFSSPAGIALTTNRKLVVVSRDKKYSLQIYSSY